MWTRWVLEHEWIISKDNWRIFGSKVLEDFSSHSIFCLTSAITVKLHRTRLIRYYYKTAPQECVISSQKNKMYDMMHCKLWNQTRTIRPKKALNVFYTCVFKLNFETINGLGEPSCYIVLPYCTYCIGIGALHYIS